jgi:dCMP deaminase
MSRPSWPEYFMSIAEVVASRSPDPKTKVGSVLVKNNRIASTGYNGAPAGFNGTDWTTESKYQHVVHSELNCLLYAGIDKSQGATLYVTHSPCCECAKAIAAAGVSEVYYRTQYRDGDGCQLLETMGVRCRQHRIIPRELLGG